MTGDRDQPDLLHADEAEAAIPTQLEGIRLERGRPFADVWLGWTLRRGLRLDGVLERLLPEGGEAVPWATMERPGARPPPPGRPAPGAAGRPRARTLGQSPRTVLDELRRIQSTDVVLPPQDRRELRMQCVARPDAAKAALLDRLGLELPQHLRVPPPVARTADM